MTEPYYTDDSVTLYHGDCLDVLPKLPDSSVDAVVTDPPYSLNFMGKGWDTHASPAAFGAWCEAWARHCLRVLKPGGHMLAFGGTRTWHRLAVAIEDAGFEIRDSIAWLAGSGFPKSRNVSRDLDDRRCHCVGVESSNGSSQGEHRVERRGPADSVLSLRDSGQAIAEPGQASGSSLLLSELPVKGPLGDVGGEPLRPHGKEAEAALRGGQPSMEGRGNAEASEGELQGRSLRPLSPGVPADGESGRLHHGASPRDGEVDRSPTDTAGVREPHQPRPIGQPQGEPGAVSNERGSQARGGWPVCDRCSQPVVPDGLGTALKPSFEPVVVARKPLAGTVAANVLEHGTGALNIDGCRISMGAEYDPSKRQRQQQSNGSVPFASAGLIGTDIPTYNPAGRWPANVTLDEDQAAALDEQSGDRPGFSGGGTKGAGFRDEYVSGSDKGWVNQDPTYFSDTGGASRFFYVAKAGSDERITHNGTAHPTVKPLDLMRWLVRLVTPPGGLILEPFAGSGTTVEAALLEGFRCIAIEREADYLPLITQRINRRRDPVAYLAEAGEELGLFGESA